VCLAWKAASGFRYSLVHRYSKIWVRYWRGCVWWRTLSKQALKSSPNLVWSRMAPSHLLYALILQLLFLFLFSGGCFQILWFCACTSKGRVYILFSLTAQALVRFSSPDLRLQVHRCSSPKRCMSPLNIRWCRNSWPTFFPLATLSCEPFCPSLARLKQALLPP